MEYKTLYEYNFDYVSLLNLIPLLAFLLLAFLLIGFLKRNRKYSFFRQILLFFGYMIGFVSSIMIIVLFINVFEMISYERKLKNKECIVVEGKIKDYSIKKINNQSYERFMIKNTSFELPNQMEDNGLSRISENNEILKNKGQYLRIYYLDKNDKNVILKIEEKIH